MITYKVTYGNTATGNTNSGIIQASSLEAAIAEETRMVEMLQKRNPNMVLISVEAI